MNVERCREGSSRVCRMLYNARHVPGHCSELGLSPVAPACFLSALCDCHRRSSDALPDGADSSGTDGEGERRLWTWRPDVPEWEAGLCSLSSPSRPLGRVPGFTWPVDEGPAEVVTGLVEAEGVEPTSAKHRHCRHSQRPS